jgi:hypothetical protein
VLNTPVPAPLAFRSVARRAALAVIAIAVMASGASAAPNEGSPFTPLAAPVFRLGTAAAPFSAAKRLGDLDLDGHPDLAVVDRLIPRGGQTQYVLEVDLSSGPAQTIVFSSDQPALDITLVDVDHDGDIDIVLTPILSRAVAAIWLNNGAGQFAEATGPDSPRTLPVGGAGRASPSGYETVPAAAASSRAVFAGVTSRTTASLPDGAPVLPSRPAKLRLARPLSAGSRAPPIVISIR